MVATADLRRFRRHPSTLRAAEVHGLVIDSVGHDLFLFDERVCLRCSASRASTSIRVDVHWTDLGVSCGFHVLPRRTGSVIGAAAFQAFGVRYESTSITPDDIAYEIRFAWMMEIVADMIRPDTLRLRPDELLGVQPDLKIAPRPDRAELLAVIRGLALDDIPPMYVHLLPSEDPAVMGSSHPQINGINESAVRTHALVDGLRLGRISSVDELEPDAFLMKVGAAGTDVMSAGMHLGSAGLFVSPTLAAEMKTYTLHGVSPIAVTLNAQYPDHAREAVFLHIRQAHDLVDMGTSVFVRSDSADRAERVPLADVEAWRTQLDVDITSGRADRLRPERIELSTYPDLFRMPVTGQLCASAMLIAMLRHQGRTGWSTRHHGLPIR